MTLLARAVIRAGERSPGGPRPSAEPAVNGEIGAEPTLEGTLPGQIAPFSPRFKPRAARLVALALFAATPGHAQERPTGPPVASVSIEQVQVAFIGSVARGGGVLRYGGRSYPISIGGIGIGGIGASHLTASGAVYGLRRPADFEGLYVQLRSGWALGEQGRGRFWLRNEKGVLMRLRSQREGIQLSLGADGVLIRFQ
jgi:hypothetical protein